MPATVMTIDDLLTASAATPEFKDAVRKLDVGKSGDRIQYNVGVPAVKALRAISKLLEEEPGLEVHSVLINATSGCSDFVGKMSVNGGEVEFAFNWDCSWRAKQENYTDHFGYPDQIRAAREFKYQCFKKFERVN
jgi:hypothetical protein